jgi:hypothetical protein
MTPAAQTVFIDLVTGAARGGTSGLGLPVVNLILLTGGRLNFAFMTAGVCEELEAGTTGRLVIKSKLDAAGGALFLDEEWDMAGEATAARYAFLGLVDSDDLRAALDGKDSETFTAQLFWQQPSDDNPSSSLPFLLTITNNYNRTDDAAPIITDDVSITMDEGGQSFELWVNGISQGHAQLFTTAP